MVSALRQSLQQQLAPVSPGDLNSILANPDDLAIAQWLGHGAGHPPLETVRLQSTGAQGVELDLASGHAVAWRRYAFQAAHQLPCVPDGHKCGRMHGHGFSLVLAVPVSPAEMAVQAYARLDTVWSQWQSQLDGACLNDLPGLENPTSEMLASWLWPRIQAQLPDLVRVTVYETASCGAHFNGESYRIWKDFSMDCAVRRRGAVPQGRGITGHTFVLRLMLSAPLDQLMGWTVDYGDVKRLFHPIYLDLDHHPLFDRAGLQGGDTSALARWIFTQARSCLPSVDALALFETPGCGEWVSVDNWRQVPVGALT
jgi:6-pyruvoyltetrahydropterin/6-carboxytetrahydropterin synthase